ncbi:MAG: glycosyltransferase family 39 protein [Frankia sp.]
MNPELSAPAVSPAAAADVPVPRTAGVSAVAAEPQVAGAARPALEAVEHPVAQPVEKARAAVVAGPPVLPATALPATTPPTATHSATTVPATTPPATTAPPAKDDQPASGERPDDLVGDDPVDGRQQSAPTADQPPTSAGPVGTPDPWWHRLIVPATVAAVVIGAGLRFATDAHLWLDESLTVNIASLPVGRLLEALRHDGAPPLYYLLLHFWMKAFGGGDIAVRALSGVFSVATLPVAWVAGRRVGRVATAFGNGDDRAADRIGIAALLLFACSPYAIRYGSETRMYSLVVLLVLLFGLALVRAFERSDRTRLALLTLCTTAMVYTHYWTFLLLATVAVFLVVQARRRPHYRRPAHRALAAMLASAIPFLPWAPSFTFQMLHTGTPWAPRVHAQVLLDTVFDWAGPASTGSLLAVILLGAAMLGATARPAGRILHVDPRGRMPGRYLAALWLVPLALAYLVNTLGGSAYAERYTGISLPAFLLLGAIGIGILPSRQLRMGVLALACATGLLGGWDLAREERTQAAQIAGRINALARPGDVVAYCPDQLGPAVYRALSRHDGPPIRQIAYADPSGPALVDWVDYAARMKNANGADFAAKVNAMAGPNHAILLVRADGYKTLEGSCAVISDQLAALRDRTVQVAKRDLYEGASLERFSTQQ